MWLAPGSHSALVLSPNESLNHHDLPPSQIIYMGSRCKDLESRDFIFCRRDYLNNLLQLQMIEDIH